MQAGENVGRQGSASLDQPDYWWYTARAELLRIALANYLGSPARSLDVGSADGPSVRWMHASELQVSVDIVPRGLPKGRGVCASGLALPFASGSFDVVTAFDVVEHFSSEADALAELARALAPGGRLLLSVPAYQWAWTSHDVQAGHYRRYTRARLVNAVEVAGLEVQRVTHAFAGTFPFFMLERVQRRLRERREGSRETHALRQVPSAVERLLIALCALDGTLLRRGNLPFGSSIFLAAVKPHERNTS